MPERREDGFHVKMADIFVLHGMKKVMFMNTKCAYYGVTKV